MNENDLKFADECVFALNKEYSGTLSLGHKINKVSSDNYRDVFQILRDENWIERPNYQYKLIEYRRKDLVKYGSYSVWLLRDETSLTPNIPNSINEKEIPSKKPAKKSLFTRFILNQWTIVIIVLILGAVLNANRIKDWINAIIDGL